MILDPITNAVASTDSSLIVGKNCMYGDTPPQKIGNVFAFISETSHTPHATITPLRKSSVQVYANGFSFKGAEAMAAAVEALSGSYDVDGITYRIVSIKRKNGPVRIPGGAFSMNFTVNFTI
ncbi:hypothetical protein LF599_07540 [Pseudodesulfovibrio thermohalotolerans]|uniref:hypothetical protein n=1 Tax=Pseudodesulfovibrio thermohalotolerans TaxID=2880651 RepID=UPI0024429379|nr:hypothetical protein [Pseudodesulfovibrio thermohalotolerans]WFS64007.1 hypothetical protein LF599_07540 [Pseudodesulfovibrio thermohalotolerans]